MKKVLLTTLGVFDLIFLAIVIAADFDDAFLHEDNFFRVLCDFFSIAGIFAIPITIMCGLYYTENKN